MDERKTQSLRGAIGASGRWQGMGEGLDLAADFLERTASDYDQMAGQEQKAYDACGEKRYLGRTVHRARVDNYTEKAALLRGQAKHIRDLKK